MVTATNLVLMGILIAPYFNAFPDSITEVGQGCIVDDQLPPWFYDYFST